MPQTFYAHEKCRCLLWAGARARGHDVTLTIRLPKLPAGKTMIYAESPSPRRRGRGEAAFLGRRHGVDGSRRCDEGANAHFGCQPPLYHARRHARLR